METLERRLAELEIRGRLVLHSGNTANDRFRVFEQEPSLVMRHLASTHKVVDTNTINTLKATYHALGLLGFTVNRFDNTNHLKVDRRLRHDTLETRERLPCL